MIAQSHDFKLSQGPFREKSMVKRSLNLLDSYQRFVFIGVFLSRRDHQSISSFSGYLKSIIFKQKILTEIYNLVLFVNVKADAVQYQMLLDITLLLIISRVQVINCQKFLPLIIIKTKHYHCSNKNKASLKHQDTQVN